MNLTCFLMMQFSGQNQREVFQGIETAITRYNQTSEHSINLQRADLNPPLQIDSLEENLKQFIEACDFTIAEISQLNPNVVFELGYAIGVGKPVIVMVQEGVEPPADFRGKYYFRYGVKDLKLLPQTLRPHLEGAVNAVIAERHATRYKTVVSASRFLADTSLTLRHAEKQVDVLTTNLSSLVVGDFLDLLCDRLSARKALRVRVLAHDPESEFVAARGKQLGFEVRHFRDEVRMSAEKVVSALARFPEQSQVAYYDEFPTQITIRIDEAVYFNVVSATQQGRNNLTFKLDVARRGVAESILSHFDTIWRRAKIVFPSTISVGPDPS